MERHDLGARLQQLRRAAGLSQAEVAKALNVPQPNVARWETGKMLLPAMLVPELALLFGCSASDFFEAAAELPRRPGKKR